MKTIIKLKFCGLLLIVAAGCITVQPCLCSQVEKIQQPFYQPQFYQPQFHALPYKGIYLGESDTTTWPRFLSGDTLRLTPQNEIIKLRKLQ